MPVPRSARTRHRPENQKSPSAPGSYSLHPGWFAAALFVITMALYWPSLNHQFIEQYDDHLYVTKNAKVLEGLHLRNVVHALTHPMASNWHPLTMVSHMLDVEIYGPNPRGHHLTNILLHAAATVLLFLLLFRLTRSQWSSATVAALFALHPMHVESVAWIAERKDVLSACLWFLTTLFYVRYTERPGLRRYWPTLVFFALGLMAKPMLVTLPFTLLLLDYWPLKRVAIEKIADICTKKSLALVIEKLPLFAMAFAAAAVTYLVQSGGGITAASPNLSLLARIANATVAYATYIQKTIWIADYAVFYPHSGEWPPLWKLSGALLLLVLITGAALWQVRKQPYLAVGWFWFLGTLVPVIGIVQVGLQSMADRYSYIPSIGLFIMLVWGLLPLIVRTLGRPVAIVCTVCILLSVSASTRLQLGYWYDSETLFRHALSVTESNFTSNYSLGASLLKQGRFKEAEPYLAEAVRLSPDEVPALTALGDARFAQGKFSEAYKDFAEMDRLDPGKGYSSYTMGLLLDEMGRPTEAVQKYQQAIDEFRALLKQSPENTLTLVNLAMTLDRVGEPVEALLLLQEAQRIAPNAVAPGLIEQIRDRAPGA